MTDPSSVPVGLRQRLPRLRPLALSIWVVVAISWVYLLIQIEGRLFQATVWTVPFLLTIAILSFPWRTVTWKQLVGFFLLGMGPVFLLVALSQFGIANSPVEDWTRSGLDRLADAGFDLRLTQLQPHLWAPITEEAWKVAPLIVVVWWRRSGLRDLGGPIDYAVLAGASGAGMGFSEDLLRMFDYAALHALPHPNSALGLGRLYQNLVGGEANAYLTFISGHRHSRFTDTVSFVLPEMHIQQHVVWSGHGATALGIGLALGLAVWERRRRGNRVFYLIPGVVFLWAVWEHMMVNWYSGVGCEHSPSLLCTLAAIDLRGRIYPLAIIAAWGYALYLSNSAIGALRTADPPLNLRRQDLNLNSYRSEGWRGWLSLVPNLLDFWRLRRRTAYGAFHLQHARAVPPWQTLSLLTVRTRALILRQRLAGESPTLIPDEAEEVMKGAAPLL